MSTIKNANENVVGQSNRSISIGDKGVVTKMKKKQLTICYVPSQKEYPPKEKEQLLLKEDALFNYIINLTLFQEVLKS